MKYFPIIQPYLVDMRLINTSVRIFTEVV